MNPITLISQVSGSGYGTAHAYGSGVFANSSSLAGLTNGFMSDKFGSQSFSFSNSPLGLNFNTMGRAFSLQPDFISRIPFGRSWSVFNNGANCGSVGFNSTFNSIGFSGSLGPKLGSGITSAMASSGII